MIVTARTAIADGNTRMGATASYYFGANSEEAARRRFERLYAACRVVSGHFLRAETSSLRRSGWPMTCQLTGAWLEPDDGVLVYPPGNPLELGVCHFLMAMNLIPEDVSLVVSKTESRFHRKDDAEMFRYFLEGSARLIVTDKKSAALLRAPTPWDTCKSFVAVAYDAKSYPTLN